MLAAEEISQSEFQNALENLKPIAYTNAEQRATMAEKFFGDILKIDKVEILKNLTKQEILVKLAEIQREAIQFDKNNDDLQVVNSVFVNWIGFCLRECYHPFINQFDIDDMIFPQYFPLT